MATIIIGDIHGCLDELNQLLDVASRVNPAEYIFIGDLLDKGPDSAGVVNRVMELANDTKVTIVKGNHEDKNFKFWKKAEAGDIEAAMAMKDANELALIMERTPDTTRDWLRNKVVPYVVRPEAGFVVVHGGILPTVESLPENPDELSGKNKQRVLRNMFIRYVSPEGNMVKFGDETETSQFWAGPYDGRFGHVFFGHQPFLEQRTPVKFNNATGIDLGCVHGGHLCAAIVRTVGEAGPAEDFISIRAKREYCPPVDQN